MSYKSTNIVNTLRQDRNPTKNCPNPRIPHSTANDNDSVMFGTLKRCE